MIKIFNWNVKLWASVVVLIVVLAGIGVALSDSESKDDTAIVLSRVNTEGSGIFGDEASMVTIEDGIAVFNKEKWGGKVVATPGATSIQHLYIVEEMTKIGLSIKSYDASIPKDELDMGSVYLKASGVTSMIDDYNKDVVQAGITWEVVYSNVLSQTDAIGLCTTDQLENKAGHACCMIMANSSFLEKNTEVAVRYMAAYIKSVNYINDAKSDINSKEYDNLLKIAKNLLGAGYTDEVIESALMNVNYTYALTNFQQEYAGLIESYTTTGAIPADCMTTLNTTPVEFAKKHIDGTYIDRALQMEGSSTYSEKIVKVAYLGADIHQLALQVGKDMGYFADYGIVIKNIGPHTAGGAVLQSVITGEADFGFAGAPPTVMQTVNLELSR